MLAKFVFVSLHEYNCTTGGGACPRMPAHALHQKFSKIQKAEPYKFAVRERWKRLKRSDPEATSTLKPFVKAKWCGTTYFLGQARRVPLSPVVESLLWLQPKCGEGACVCACCGCVGVGVVACA